MFRSTLLLFLVFAALSFTSLEAASQVPLLRRVELLNETEADFIVSQDGRGAYVRDGRGGRLLSLGDLDGDGVLDRRSFDAGVVIQTAIDSLASEGGLVFVKAGQYDLASPVDITRSNVQVVGTRGTELSASVGSAIRILDGSLEITLRDLTFRNCDYMAVNLQHGERVRILDCDFEDCGGPAIQARVGDDPNAPVRDLMIRGCRILRCSTEGDRPAIHVYRTERLLVAGNVVEDCPATGINVQRNSMDVQVIDNVVRSCGAHGIYVGGAYGVTIRGNLLRENALNGIEAASTEGPDGERHKRFVIGDNVCLGNGTGGQGATHAGIYVTGSDHVVTGNVCRDNGGAGIQLGSADHASRIVVANNVIGNNNVQSNTAGIWSAGIALSGLAMGPSSSDQRILVQGNIVYDDAEGGVQLYGIFCHSDVDGVLISGNRLDGHSIAAITWSPSASQVVVRGNDGFRTRAFGTVSAPGITTTGSISIDLAPELDIDDVGIGLERQRFRASLASDPGTDLVYWVTDSLAVVGFDVHWRSTGSPSAFEFDYLYE